MSETTHYDALLRHPAHDAVAAELRSWHTTSTPAAGTAVTEHWFGFTSFAPGPGPLQAILTVNDASEVPAALRDAVAASGAEELSVLVDDRDRSALLGAALRHCGCEHVKATTHLTLVGELRADDGPEELATSEVDADHLAEWAAVKIRCFEDSEAAPTAAQLDHELAVRTPGRSIERLRLAWLGSEPVAVVGFYGGDDQLVFTLGTRVPYRHRGVAQGLLKRWVADGTASGSRSLTINADDPGRPAELYRRLGFVDEVYWYERYLLYAAVFDSRATSRTPHNEPR